MKLKLLSASLSMALLVGCGDQNTPAQTDNKTEVSKAEVSLTSGVIGANFDKAVRPQDDFYRFVNGTWLSNTEIPADRSNYGTFTALADKAQEDVRTIIEESASAKDLEKGSDAQKVGDLYNSVLDTAVLETLGVEPLKPYFAEIDAIKTKSDLAAYFALVSKRGSTVPFGMYVNNDAKDPSQYIVYMYQSGLSLPNKEYYFENNESSQSIRDAFVTHIETMFGLAGLANGQSAAKDIMALETAIASGHWNKEDSRNSVKTYNKHEIAKLNELAADFDWTAFFDATGISGETHIIVRQPSYLTAFNAVFNDTAIETWKTYLTWHLLTGNAGLMNAALDDENFKFFGSKLSGTPEQQPRWKRGVNAVNGLLGEVVGKVYVSKHFKPEAKARMMTMIENLREAYRQGILELDWMGEDTKKQALDKLAKFNPKIGYPDAWRDYSALVIEPGQLVKNYMSAREFNYNTQLGKLGKPIDKNEWFMTPQTVNAYYNPVMNEIVFPAAILQPPFFDMSADDAVNYGGIGAVIGHEMGHGFDDQGASYDGDGVLRDWWTEQDKAEFKNRTAALGAQYDEFEPLPGVHVNGEFTMGENIGDLGGMTIAYKAYQLSLNDKPSVELDGFTGEQRFFIGWAQVWARKYRDEEMKRRIKTDPHSPSEYRANGVLRNMPEFVAAFDVKEGDALFLAPEKRVKIW